MTRIVHTIHRQLPQLITEAIHKSIVTSGSRKKHMARIYKRLGEEECARRYETAKALNIKHGIDPKHFRQNHKLFKGNPRRSRAKVTLPKL